MEEHNPPRRILGVMKELPPGGIDGLKDQADVWFVETTTPKDKKAGKRTFVGGPGMNPMPPAVGRPGKSSRLKLERGHMLILYKLAAANHAMIYEDLAAGPGSDTRTVSRLIKNLLANHLVARPQETKRKGVLITPDGKAVLAESNFKPMPGEA